MSETNNTDPPRGGLRPVSRRVMNLAHLLTQNARRHGDRVGFIWGDRSWTWRQIDHAVSALAAALAARGIVKGDRILVHSKNGDEMFLSMFCRVPAGRNLGADQFPADAGRSRLSRERVRCQGSPVSRRFPRSRRGG